MKRSVHFGMNKVNPDKYNGWNGNLYGCYNDADDMLGVFAGLGYDATGFFDEECVIQLIRDVFGKAQSLGLDDWFLFTDSGHGSRQENFLAGSVESICLYDGLFPDYELRGLIASLKCNVVVILDTCFSGGMDRGMVRTRLAPPHVTDKMAVAPRQEVRVTNPALLLSAARATETAQDGDDNGAFTGSLLESKFDGITWQGWFDRTSRYMSRAFPQQHPVLTSLNGNLAGQPV